MKQITQIAANAIIVRELLSISTAAKKYDVSEVYLRKKIEKGEITRCGKDKMIRIQKIELDEFFGIKNS